MFLVLITLLHLPFCLAVSDHGIARLEGVLEEALQDLPSLVHEIQERLRGEVAQRHTVHCRITSISSTCASIVMVLSSACGLLNCAVLSDSVADEEGQPKAGLPPRRMLWDQLKPQAAQVCMCLRLCLCVCTRVRDRKRDGCVGHWDLKREIATHLSCTLHFYTFTRAACERNSPSGGQL